MARSLTNQAQAIAKRDLQACYLDGGILAGKHHFTDYWARDAFFAALGSLTIGDRQIVTSLVDLFFSYQRPDGLIPYILRRGPVSLNKYLGKPTPVYPSPRPVYRLRSVGQPVLDGTTLAVLFAALTQRKKHLPAIRVALQYLKNQEKNGLLWDGPMAEWNDMMWKWGNLLYTNIIYWYLYDRLSAWIQPLDPAWGRELHRHQTEIAQALRNRLWNGRFFADWYDYKRQDFLYPFGNCLAIAWGLTTPAESAAILAEVDRTRISFGIESNFPKYPWWRVDLFNRLVGMSDYQNQSLIWWQPVTSYLKALSKLGHHTTYNNLLSQISAQVVHDGTVYECYERDGQPVQRFTYTSEHPFAWGAGMILWATHHEKN